MPSLHRCVLLVMMVWGLGCTRRLYEGPALPPEHVATIHVGSTVVRELDGQKRRGGAFDASHFEVVPGRHRIVLVFELPARSMGLKTFPAQSGRGTCALEFDAVPGRQYFLGSRARGETSSLRWDGAWEGWIRDPAVESADDIIARCASEVSGAEEVAPTTTPIATTLPTPSVPGAVIAPPSSLPPVPSTPARPAPTVSAVAPASPSAGVPFAASPPAPSAAMTIRLGEWNLRSLGRSDDKDVALIATIIEANFDILVVTEIVQRDNGHPGYDALLKALGGAWAGSITDAPRPRNVADGEFYAMFYRRERVRPCSGWTGLRSPSEGGGADRFLREPAFECFEAGDPSRPGVDFLLAAYHAPWADGDAVAIAAEVAQLDDVFTAMKATRPADEDLIIAGDFHLESVELAEVTRATDRTRGTGSVLNLLGNRTANLPDHILVFDSRGSVELLGDAEVVDVRGAALSNKEFYRTVSDHLPIMIRIRVTGPDDD